MILAVQEICGLLEALLGMFSKNVANVNILLDIAALATFIKKRELNKDENTVLVIRWCLKTLVLPYPILRYGGRVCFRP